MLKHYCAWVTLSVSVLLGACGGGGSGSGSGSGEPVAAAVPLSVANYDAISLVVVLSVLGSQSVDNFVALSAGEDESQGATAFRVLGSGKVDAIARFALESVAVRPTSKVQAAAAEPVSQDCPAGGSLLVSINDADGSGDVSPGDSRTYQADNCVMVSGQPAVDGALTIGIQALSGASSSLTFAFTDFSSAGFVFNGSATYSADATGEILTYNQLTGAYKDQTLTHNFTVVRQLNVSPNMLTVSGNIVRNGSSYALTTPGVLQLGDYYPTEGRLRIADGQGGRVDVVMGSTGFLSQLYLPGNEVFVAATPHLWSDL